MKLRIKNLRRESSGQVALVVLVLMAVSLSLGLSVSSEVMTETKIDKDEELLKQAFNAAESGIEFYLGTGKTDYVAPDGESQAEVDIENIGGDTELNFDEFTVANDIVNFWLIGHEADGSLDYDNSLGDNFVGTGVDICLNNSFNSTIEFSYFYRDLLNYGVRRWIYQVGADGGTVNDATIVSDNGNCGTDRIGLTVDFSGLGDTSLLLSVRPLFNAAQISLNGGAFSFPEQGITISSVGMAGNVTAVAEAVNRRISISRRWGAGILDFMIDGLVAEEDISSE